MARNRIQAVVIGGIGALALAAALYTVQAGRQGAGGETGGVVTNLQTANASRVESVAHGLVGKRAPEVVLPDLSGHLVNLEQFRGQRVILNFWTTW